MTPTCIFLALTSPLAIYYHIKLTFSLGCLNRYRINIFKIELMIFSKSVPTSLCPISVNCTIICSSQEPHNNFESFIVSSLSKLWSSPIYSLWMHFLYYLFSNFAKPLSINSKQVTLYSHIFPYNPFSAQ